MITSRVNCVVTLKTMVSAVIRTSSRAQGLRRAHHFKGEVTVIYVHIVRKVLIFRKVIETAW